MNKLANYILRKLSAEPDIPLKRLGTVYGGWYFPEKGISKDDIIISAGAGEDISFDIFLAHKFCCHVHILDPTPRAQLHFKDTKKKITNGEPAAINFSDKDFYIQDKQVFNCLKFYPVGLLNKNTHIFFYEPGNKNHVSHSIGNRHNTKDGFMAGCIRLKDFLLQINAQKIKALKMDIEGAEYRVILDLILCGIRPDYLLIEFHHGKNLLEKMITNNRILYCLLLRFSGYLIVSRNGNDFVFERKKIK